MKNPNILFALAWVQRHFPSSEDDLFRRNIYVSKYIDIHNILNIRKKYIWARNKWIDMNEC